MPQVLRPRCVTLAILLLMPSTLFAQKEFNERFSGSWSLEIDKTKALLAEGSEDLAKFQAQLDAGFEEARLGFKTDGLATITFRFNGEDVSMEGSWELTESNDDGPFNVTIEFQDQPEETVVNFQDEDTIRIDFSNQPSNILVRLKGDESDDKQMEQSDAGLVGTWKADLERTKTLMKESGESEDSIDDNLEELERMTVSFKSNHEFALTTIREGETMTRDGIWKLEGNRNEDGENTLVCEFDGREIKLTFKELPDGLLQMRPEGEAPAIFSRVKAELGEGMKSTDEPDKTEKPIG